MNWYRNLSNTEYLFIGSFFLLYLIFLGRTLWIAYQLGSTARAVVLKFILRFSYFTLLVMALLDPSFGETQSETKAVGRDILLLVDVSKSMDGNDIQPSRLEKIKFELLKLIDDFPNDRFGMIVFAADAYAQAPLSFDKTALKDLFLKSINTNMFSESGTALFPALELAYEKHNSNQNRRNTAKIIVLVTDGEDFGGINNDVLRKIRAYEMKLFVLGVGTINGSKIRVPSGYLLDEDANLVISKLDRETLQDLAKKANGTYFETSNLNNGFKDLSHAILESRGTLVDQRKVIIQANKYNYFVIAALLLVIFDILVVVRVLKL